MQYKKNTIIKRIIEFTKIKEVLKKKKMMIWFMNFTIIYSRGFVCIHLYLTTLLQGLHSLSAPPQTSLG